MSAAGHVFLARGSLPKPRFRKTRLHNYPVTRETAPLVTPLCVFAAGRQKFDVIVRWHGDARQAYQLIDAALPLKANGWKDARLEIVGETQDGWPIWRIERG